jgi:insertion element IS1 protein InsB
MEKNPLWIGRAINSVSRRSLGGQLGGRDDASLQGLIQKIDDGKCTFVRGEWGGFFRLLPEKRHFFGKDLTFPIEATNSDIRHLLARFKRQSKVTSRSLDRIERSLLLFHYFQDYPENLEPIITSFISFFSYLSRLLECIGLSSVLK